MALKTGRTITLSRRVRVFVLAVVATIALLWPHGVWAHPDLIEQIDHLSTEIKQAPGNPTIYLQRAEVYRQHAQYVEALADVDNASRAKADVSVLHLARCKIYADSGKHLEAVKEADALLVLVPHHPETLALRAKAKVYLGQTNEALADYSLAISNFPHAEPDLVLERMRLQIASGKTAEAVAGLDEGLKRIGPAIQLQTAAIECERAAKNWEGALVRLETIIARMPIKEPWLLQRAELLEEAGRKPEAKSAYNQVVEGIEGYPTGRKALVVNRELAERARLGLQRVSGDSAAVASRSASFSN
jgi:tetratricopeptide (TPR) repeat protein